MMARNYEFVELDQKSFLVVVDYYSRLTTVHKLTGGTPSEAVIKELNKLFCMLGIPNTIVSDNGPQFV